MDGVSVILGAGKGELLHLEAVLRLKLIRPSFQRAKDRDSHSN